MIVVGLATCLGASPRARALRGTHHAPQASVLSVNSGIVNARLTLKIPSGAAWGKIRIRDLSPFTESVRARTRLPPQMDYTVAGGGEEVALDVPLTGLRVHVTQDWYDTTGRPLLQAGYTQAIAGRWDVINVKPAQ
jgi:hypothetical protein